MEEAGGGDSKGTMEKRLAVSKTGDREGDLCHARGHGDAEKQNSAGGIRRRLASPGDWLDAAGGSGGRNPADYLNRRKFNIKVTYLTRLTA